MNFVSALQSRKQTDLSILGHSGLSREFQANQGYIVTPCLRKTKKEA